MNIQNNTLDKFASQKRSIVHKYFSNNPETMEIACTPKQKDYLEDHSTFCFFEDYRYFWKNNASQHKLYKTNVGDKENILIL